MDFAERFAEQGWLAVERLFDPALIAAIFGEYQRQFGGLSMAELPPHLGVGDKRVQVPMQLTGALLDPMLTAHPLLLRLVGQIVGKDALIDSFTCVVAYAGAGDQQLHRDHHELFPGATEPGEGLEAFALTAAIPLIDLTPATGTTRLFAGSHRLAGQPGGKPPELGQGQLPYAARGDAYFMDYRLWHQGTANRSPDPRPILYIVYARGWFTDLLNFRDHARLRMSKEDLTAMPPAQRRLFRRLAAKGAYDLTEAELMGE